MQEQWHMSTDTAEAAAFAALRATIKIVANLHQRTATREVRLFISPQTEGGIWRVGKIRQAMKTGALVRSEPAHPYLTARRAMANREAILDIQNKGKRFVLLPVPGTSGIHQFMPGDSGLPGVKSASAAIVRSTDIKMAAALVTTGFPLLAIDGSAPHHIYSLAAFQTPATPLDGATLVSQWRADASAMPFDLPFVQAATALLFREQLRREISAAIDTVLITKNPITHAAVRADAAPQAWDKVARFFNGTR